MTRSSLSFKVAAVLLAGALTLTSGCFLNDDDHWLPGLPIGFGIGFLTGLLVPGEGEVTVVRECYQNGVQVDCDDLSIPIN